MKRIVVQIFLCLLFARTLAAADEFVVKDIRVEGLQRISAGTVFNYLPVKIGDKFKAEGSKDAIHALYQTGFFKDVKLKRDGAVLIVTVLERPSISIIKIKGTKEISEKDLLAGLKDTGFAEGRIFNRSMLERVERELELQYFSRGFYSVRVVPTVTPLERNRVAINIEVKEGGPAKIKEIIIVGNEAFDDEELRDRFELSSTGFWSFLSKNDQYSKQKLAADLETIKNFYQNQGYLEFDIESTQVSITPDKENIYITVNLREGKKFTIAGYKLAGNTVLPEEKIKKAISIKPGDVFSRREITDSTNRIMDKLGDAGYAFANANAIPDINHEKAEVSFTFFIDPGKRVYVRRINFTGNSVTHDNVLRREMRQLEGAWYSTRQIKRSRQRLERLGFFESVNVETPQVPGSADQVDINISVKERPTGNLMFGIGYSDLDGFLVNASVTESNLFGTGNELSASYDNSQSVESLNLKYVNPYYTKSGISRGFNIYQTKIDAEEADIAAYANSTYGAGVFFGIPTSEERTLRLGLAYEVNDITIGSDAPVVAEEYVDAYGERSEVFKATVGWSQDSLDNPILPFRGGYQSISTEFTTPGGDLQYYKVTYENARYLPVTRSTTLKAKLSLGYGNGYDETDYLPFYKNFYAGGSSTVRGYRSRSLGPRDPVTDDTIGGNKRVLGNLEYLFPMPGADPNNRSMRLGLFVDGGMVYGSREEVDLEQVRYSAGVAFSWFSPVGPLSLSYASPLNKEPDDDIELIQFTLGVPLR